MSIQKVELRSPAGSLTGVKLALEAGADAVYVGLCSRSNLRIYPGVNLSIEDAKKACSYAHARNKGLYIVVNSYPQADELDDVFTAVDDSHSVGADAIIVSDIAVLDYAKRTYPNLSIHLSTQAAVCNSEAIDFYKERFDISCVILPRVLTVGEISEISKKLAVQTEVFAMGSLCMAYSGRCHLSQYVTGESINTNGVCTSPKFLTLCDTGSESQLLQLNGITINEFSSNEIIGQTCEKHEYPSIQARPGYCDPSKNWSKSFVINKRHICKGQYLNESTGKRCRVFHDEVILNVLPILPSLIEAGVGALKIEGRQRDQTYSYRATKVLRRAIDSYYCLGSDYYVRPEWTSEVSDIFPGCKESLGPYIGR